jgi:nicotinic acid phosphoribosyltransferase
MRPGSSHHGWLLRDGPALLMDLYELTTAQTYFTGGMNGTAYFEVTVRLPEGVRSIRNPAEYHVVFA